MRSESSSAVEAADAASRIEATVASARSPVTVAILDSREGVAGQLARVARARLSRRRRAAERDDLLLVTAEPEDPLRYRRIAGMFGIGVCGALER